LYANFGVLSVFLNSTDIFNLNVQCQRLAGKKAVSHSEVPRKRKKITFADETGGKLCHVKMFTDGQNSLLSECHSE
jgi:hypothetical protein